MTGVFAEVYQIITNEAKKRKFNFTIKADLRAFQKIVIKLIRFCSNPQLVLSEIYEIDSELGEALAGGGLGPKLQGKECLLQDAKKLINNGYNEFFLNESLHKMLTLPFFLLLMTGLAAILSMSTLKKSENVKFLVLGIVTSIIIFYFKDLSIALGQTDRIPIILSIWAPLIALSSLIFVGIIQINEK